MRLHLFVTCLAVVAACGDQGGGGDELTITLDAGKVHGAAVGEMRHFLGIPYAAPPVGPDRFRAPQPVTPWTEVRDALLLGSRCPQSSLAGSSDDEDCLFVNVWAPSHATKLPVMVWLHGGAFVFGSGGDPYYDGSNLAAGGVIVVTLNYRLGLFGFLAHPALVDDDPAFPTAGNYGLEDQRAALHLVQRNIAAFGVDPTKFTLCGESAGGMSTCLHYLSSRTSGLFQAAIAESGLCSSSLLELPAPVAQAPGTLLAAALGCPGSDATTIACLRAKSPDELLAAPAMVAGAVTPGGSLFQMISLPGSLPNVDGLVVSQPSATLAAAAQFEARPLILGNVLDEGTLFTSALFATPVTDESEFRAALATRFTSQVVDAIVAHYPVTAFPSANAALAQVINDGFFHCPSARFSKAVTARGAVEYRYSFEQALSSPIAPGLGVFHSSELPFVFGNDNFPLGKVGPSSDATSLATAIQHYWTQFATFATPNYQGAVTWPMYNASTEPQLVLAATLTTATNLDDAACALWAAIE
ncbi:carboxylesterase family protein [soil metagenome]